MRLSALIFGCCISIGAAHAEDIASINTEPDHAAHENAGKTSELMMRAFGMIGTRYKYGGDIPENGVDCSGLVRYLFKEVWGTELPRTSREISRIGRKILPQDLSPGDLVFYNTLRRAFSHVGIYLGDHKFIHAPSSGGGVRIENMNLGYWKKRFNGARRMNTPEQEDLSARASTNAIVDTGDRQE